MKHPDCFICKSEIEKIAYAYQKHFFCQEHLIEARKGKYNIPLKKRIDKNKDTVL